MKLSFCDITKKYIQNYALENFSSELENGIYGLLGPNGAGKTTLINIFVGLLECDYGEIFINNKNIKQMGVEFLSYIGYLPQYPKFYKNFKVCDFLAYMCVIKNIPKEEAKIRTIKLLNTVNLMDYYDSKISELSGGMRQRLGIVQAMLNDPQILILDEPTAGLDPQERIRFRNLITKFAENKIVLLATHIVSDIEFFANEVILLKKGKLLKQDKPVKLMNEINDKVWMVNTTNKSLDKYLNKYLISNIMRNNEDIQLRIISDDKPEENASNVNANLDDVFLYYCGEVE